LGLEKGRWWMHWIVNDGKKMAESEERQKQCG
jgi:hypothetical protein